MTTDDEDELRALEASLTGGGDGGLAPGGGGGAAARVVSRTTRVVILPDGTEYPLDGVALSTGLQERATVTPVTPLQTAMAYPAPYPRTFPPQAQPLPGVENVSFFEGSWRTTALGWAKALITILGTFLVVPEMSGIPEDWRPFVQLGGVLLALIQGAKGSVEKDKQATGGG